MTSKEIQPIYERIISALNQKELKTAFDLLSQLIPKTSIYQYQDELFEIQETYRQLLHYYVTGSTDPMRLKIFSELIASVYEITDKIIQKTLTADSPELYYSLRRTAMLQPDNIAKLTGTIRSAYDIENITQAETLMPRLFKAIWTSMPLTDDDMNSLQQSLLADNVNDTSGYMTLINCQIIAALIIALQAFFDKRKILLLLYAAGSKDDDVRIRAYTGILITLYHYHQRIDYYPDILRHLDALSENEDFNKTIYLMILRFILSRDTEKITNRMKEEIVTEMMKLHTKTKQSSQEITPEFIDFEMNPEWMEKFENSALGKKLEEFSRLQEEGADVMLFSFVNLKHFPFFNEISNWFLPFHKGLSFLSTGNIITNALDIMTKTGLMCNSDLFSFYFSIMMMREEGRLGMVDKLESQLSEWKEQKSADLQTNVDKTERIIGHFIQDLYRFYKLYPRRNEFRDIFTQLFDFHNLPILQRYFYDKNDLLNIAEYYLHKNYFEDALTIYRHLSDLIVEDEMLYQKKGYCRQMTGDYKGALDDYMKAELINPESKWMLRRIAQCYRAIKKPEQALNYYLRLEKSDPDNLSVLLNIGACLLEMKNYEEAMKYYFKVDYLDHENSRAWRPIAWCSFLIGKYEQAQNYYRKILAADPSYLDYLNAGHTEWAFLRLQAAHDFYVQSIQTAKSFDTFYKEFSKDIHELLASGILPDDIPFMLDKVRYSFSNTQ